jgi:3-dehydroquinate synthase
VTVTVELGDESYVISVGERLLERTDELLPEGTWSKAAVVTDSNVGPLYAARVENSLRRRGVEVHACTVEAGEASKSPGVARDLLERLAALDFARTDLVAALGGGVVGDLAGFVASVYMRGVDVLQIPTTLMSQVDSAIGGKTGVNLEAGKNLVGTFHQPVAVIADTGSLRTLPGREYRSGLAEVAKYSFLRPEVFGGDPGMTDDFPASAATGVEADAVARCAAVKAQVVSIDERDATGARAALNYGHTLGHALESATGYRGEYSHGEAVAIGMVFAAAVSERMGLCDRGMPGRHASRLGSLGLPVAPGSGAPDFDALLGAMRRDKKRRSGLTMVLLEGEGKPVIRGDLDPVLLRGCYSRIAEGV